MCIVHSNKSDIFLEKLQMLICIENLWIENALPHHWKFLQKNIKFVFKNIFIYFTISYKGNVLVQEVGRRKILSFLRHHMMQNNPGFSVTDILDFGSRECLPTPKDRPRHPITFRTIDQKMGNHAVAMQSLRLAT